ncbi:hypothetical protein ACP275_03G038600 [Erythranthe tilingii]
MGVAIFRIRCFSCWKETIFRFLLCVKCTCLCVNFGGIMCEFWWLNVCELKGLALGGGAKRAAAIFLACVFFFFVFLIFLSFLRIHRVGPQRLFEIVDYVFYLLWFESVSLVDYTN